MLSRVMHRWIIRENARLIPRISDPFSTGSRRYKWMLSKTPSHVVPHGQVIMENEDGHKKIPDNIVELKHYLRTRELSKETRIDLIRARLDSLVVTPVDPLWSQDYFSTMDTVFMHFYKKTGQIDSVLPMEKVYQLFDKTVQFYLDNQRTDYPNYLAILAQKLTRTSSELPTSVLINLLEIGSSSRLNGLYGALHYILQTTRGLGSEFTVALLDRQAAKGALNLDTYETMLSIKGHKNNHRIINDEFVRSFITHIEGIFADSNPKVHEYLDLNKNIQRVQYLTNKIIHEYLKNGSTVMALRLLKFKTDLNSVYASSNDKDSLETILMHIQAHGEHNDFEEVKTTLLRQNIDDESLAESLLTQLANKKSSFDSFLQSMCEFVENDEIKFSSSLRLRAKLLKNSFIDKDTDVETVFGEVKEIYEPFVANCESPSTVLNDTLQALSSYNLKDTQILLDMTCQDFVEQTGVELSIVDYKIMIDRAIDRKQRDIALSLFEESLNTSSVHWAESVDPTIGYTLDNLALILVKGEESVFDIFPLFKKIKQHMPVSFSAEVLSKLSKKMLNEACVGDAIELIKRELPNIDKDSYCKIRLDLPYNTPYQKLFNELYKFVTTYTKDETFETNWVLYGEIHKYFHIPPKTYLPVIKFFCESERLNAALLIVRRMKMLNELHAKENINPAPSREIYTYLLKVFGDELYEEGVVEVHEYLKMDTTIENQDIDMQNCILNAYSNLQNIGKARDLFLSISSNPKQQGGINEETAQIMIKTYTYSGLPYVQKFWNSLSQFGIFPDYAVFKQYLIAHTYHGNIEGAIKLVEEIDDYNLEFSSDVLLSMHNYCIEPTKQKELAAWAMVEHREKWEELKQGGLLKSATPYMPDNNLIASGIEE